MPLAPPPLQVPLPATPTMPFTHSGQGWMPGMVPNGSVPVSPVRKISELSGRETCAVPNSQSSVPEASIETELYTQVLVGVLAVLGIGSGPPKKQPALLHVRLLPVSADVDGPRVAVCPVQLSILVMDDE